MAGDVGGGERMRCEQNRKQISFRPSFLIRCADVRKGHVVRNPPIVVAVSAAVGSIARVSSCVSWGFVLISYCESSGGITTRRVSEGTTYVVLATCESSPSLTRRVRISTTNYAKYLSKTKISATSKRVSEGQREGPLAGVLRFHFLFSSQPDA